jgi:hypothetical protein
MVIAVKKAVFWDAIAMGSEVHPHCKLAGQSLSPRGWKRYDIQKVDSYKEPFNFALEYAIKKVKENHVD